MSDGSSTPSWATPPALGDEGEEFWELPVPGLDSDDDDPEDEPGPVGAAKAKAKAKAVARPGHQTLQERYGSGVVSGAVGRQQQGIAAGSTRVSAHAKEFVWEKMRVAVQEQSEGCFALPRRDVSEWIVRTVNETILLSPTNPAVRVCVRSLEAAQKVLGEWLAPRTRDGQCKRAPTEARVFLELGCASSLISLYTYKLRPCELVWSRYLPSVLQRKLIQRGAGSGPQIRAAIDEIFARFRSVEPGKAILYLLVPRRGRKWYIGMAKTDRKQGTAVAPGAVVRGMEHLAGVFAPGRSTTGAKYQGWAPIGALAIAMIPVTCRPVEEIRYLESFVISRDQPNANKQGRKVEKQGSWEHRQRNAMKGPRAPKWQRTPTDPTTACALNFWDQPSLVLRAVRNEWRVNVEDTPTPPTHENSETDPLQGPYKRVYSEVKLSENSRGPIDIYAKGNERLLANYIATSSTWEVAIQTERLQTCRLMELYMLGGEMNSDSKRKMLRARVAGMLRRRGVRSAGEQHVTWIPGGCLTLGKAMETLEWGIEELAYTKKTSEFWRTRIQLHVGAARTTAQGACGKNMRAHAQTFSMERQRAMQPHERYRALCKDPIQLVEKNVHVKQISDPERVDADNIKKISTAIDAMGCPIRLKQQLESRVRYAAADAPCPRAPTAHHREYVDSVKVPREDVGCTLDRNPRGMGVLTLRMYHTAMQTLFAEDEVHYELVEPEERKAEIMRRVNSDERNLRPPMIPPAKRRGAMLSEEDLGMEYINLKEKCTSHDPEMSREAGDDRFALTCTKNHSHWREVSIQGTTQAQAAWIRSGARALDHVHKLEPGASLRVGDLSSLGDDVRARFARLRGDNRFRRRCRRCRRRKNRVCLTKYDLGQQFKSITPKMVTRCVDRMLHRATKKWGCHAVVEKRVFGRKPKFSLIKRGYKRRGERVWSFRDLRKLVAWTNSQTVTICGVHLLVRTKGTPMGSSISPVKACIVTSACEGAAWSNPGAARRAGYLREGESVDEVVGGARIADDGVLFSKLLCCSCLFTFGEKRVYRKPLIFEREEFGDNVQVADRHIAAPVDDDDEDFLDVTLVDKNTEYACGACSTPKRIRYTPNLGYTSLREVTAWLAGRMHDQVRKQASATKATDLMVEGSVDAAVEIILLGHAVHTVQKALRMIRDPSLKWLCRIVGKWLRLEILPGMTPAEVQDRCWQLHKDRKIA